VPDPSSNTLPLFNDSCIEKEDGEEIDKMCIPVGQTDRRHLYASTPRF
jgi:hypothetical protein